MFVSQAYAQGAGGTGGDLFAMLVPLILIMGVFWFLLIRPQQQRAKAHQELVRGRPSRRCRGDQWRCDRQGRKGGGRS
jgi:hypothetical protein